MRKQPMAAGDVYHTAAAKQTPDSPRGLPRLEQFLARQASCVTHGTRQPMKERVVREAGEIVVGQSSARRKRERHASSIAANGEAAV